MLRRMVAAIRQKEGRCKVERIEDIVITIILVLSTIMVTLSAIVAHFWVLWLAVAVMVWATAYHMRR